MCKWTCAVQTHVVQGYMLFEGILNHYIVHFVHLKYMQFLFFNYTSIKLGERENIDKTDGCPGIYND